MIILSRPMPVGSLKGANAKELQTLLSSAGYPLSVDGFVGPNTLSAFAQFKKDAWLSDLGVLGVSSLNALMIAAEQRKCGLTPTEAVKSAATSTEPESTGLTSKMLPVGGAVYVERPIIEGGSFSWSELTKGGRRWPTNRYEQGNIVEIAKAMQQARSLLGNSPIRITSGFRPAAINRAVGGARNSRHVHGDAVDFYVEGKSVGEVYAKLNHWWGGKGGLAPSYGGGFVHIDKRGYFARWRYG